MTAESQRVHQDVQQGLPQRVDILTDGLVTKIREYLRTLFQVGTYEWFLCNAVIFGYGPEK